MAIESGGDEDTFWVPLSVPDIWMVTRAFTFKTKSSFNILSLFSPPTLVLSRIITSVSYIIICFFDSYTKHHVKIHEYKIHIYLNCYNRPDQISINQKSYSLKENHCLEWYGSDLCFQVHYNVGKNLADNGNQSAAISYYREAVRYGWFGVCVFFNCWFVLKKQKADTG